MQSRALALATLAAVLIVPGCGGGDESDGDSKTAKLPGEGKPPVRIATKNFTEEYVLGELYAQALRAKGFSIVLKQNVGSSEIVDRALEDGVIDAYPEYIGVIASELAGSHERTKSADETYRRARAYEQARGFTILDRTPGSDSDANVVKPRLARKYELRTIADLKKLPHFKYGAPPENKTRYQGTIGMRQAYGLRNFNFVALPIERRYQALDSGKVDVVAGFTTDGQLAHKDRYVALEDPEGIFGYQNIVPVVNKKVLAAQGPEFASTLNAVSAKLTNDALQTMNAAVDLDGRKPAEVAREFLQQNGLL